VVRGTFTLWGAKAETNPCAARGGHDLASGTRVAVTSNGGRTIAEARLSQPRPDAFHLGCVFGFVLKHLPRAETYTIGIGHRDGLTYSYEELAQANWKVALNLGAAR
jgi:hypothetical protein